MRIVKTAPCPQCRSFRTEAYLLDTNDPCAPRVVLRVCVTCTWCWDAADGSADQYADDRHAAGPIKVMEARA